MQRFKFLILLFALYLCESCQSENNEDVIVFDKSGSPYELNEDLEIEAHQTVRIKPGAELIIGDSVFIRSHGDVIIEGTAENPVHIHGKTKKPGWGQLQLKGDAQNFIIRNAIIEDGTLTSYGTNNIFEDVTFVNDQDLNWQYATARFWYGKVSISRCNVTGPNKVEGFLLHDVNHAIVQDCSFERVPDGVEFINCDDGKIINNVFRNSHDDGIDLNGCHRIEIISNRITKIVDSGMEIGSQNFGSSSDILVSNNRIDSCRAGIILKESSTASFVLDTILNCKKGFEITTPADSIRLTNARIEKCLLLNNDVDVDHDDKSVVELID